VVGYSGGTVLRCSLVSDRAVRCYPEKLNSTLFKMAYATDQ
jgi:hypothetical protein